MPEPELEELRSGEESMTPQRMTSVAGRPNNHLYINSGASIHTFCIKELLEDLMNLNRSLKIQADGKPIHLSQIGFLH